MTSAGAIAGGRTILTSTAPIVWVNGSQVDASSRHVSALDRGLTLGDGLFETVRLYGRRLFRLDRHLSRLRDGCHALGLPVPAGVGDMVSSVVQAGARAGYANATVRVTVTRGVGPRGVAPPPSPEPTVVIVMQPLSGVSAVVHERGIDARIASGRRNDRSPTAGLKTLAYVDAVVALAQARAAGADDALFLDTHDHLAEATSSNLFLVVDDTLCTPPLSCGVLPGITRAAILECAIKLGVDTAERELSLEDLARSREAFLTSSVREVVPLVRVDDRAVGDGTPGALTHRFIDAYADLVRCECLS
jgi:branched-chain amino acid aminotransferase